MIKRLGIGTAVLVLTIADVPGARAQLSQSVGTYVPFAFEAGNRTLPPGRYVITRALDGAVQIAGEDRQQFAFATTHSARCAKRFTTATLEFHRINGRYYFNGVWEPGNEVGLEAWPSGAEREASRALEAHHPTGPRQVESIYVSARLHPGVTP